MDVTLAGSITDPDTGVDPNSAEYAIVDEYRKVQLSGHITLDSAGNYSFKVLLTASREGNDKDGRTYYVRVRLATMPEIAA